MKKYKLSNRYLDKCMGEIEHNCLLYGHFSGLELNKFCQNPKHLYAIYLLDASGDIRMVKPDNSEFPTVIFLENKGFLRSYTNREKLVSSVKGFIAGVISGVLVTVCSQFILNHIAALLF